jgi:hypothetical protein
MGENTSASAVQVHEPKKGGYLFSVFCTGSKQQHAFFAKNASVIRDSVTSGLQVPGNGKYRRRTFRTNCKAPVLQQNEEHVNKT